MFALKTQKELSFCVRIPKNLLWQLGAASEDISFTAQTKYGHGV